jgi:hypothetical protein
MFSNTSEEIYKTWPDCTAACKAIGEALGYDQKAIDIDLKKHDNHYALLRTYLKLLEEKSSELSESSRQEAQAELIKKAQDKNEYKKFKKALEQHFHFGMLERFTELPEVFGAGDNDHTAIINILNTKYSNSKYSSNINTLEKSILTLITTNKYLEENSIKTIIEYLPEIVKGLKSFENIAKHFYDKTNNNKYLRIINSCQNRMQAYKCLFNDLIELVKRNGNQNIKSRFCEEMDKIFLDYISSKMREAFGYGYQQSAKISNALKKDIPEALSKNTVLLNKYTSFINYLCGIQPTDKNTTNIKPTVKDFIDLLNEIINSLQHSSSLKSTIEHLNKIKFKILSEWSIHLTSERSDQGDFGCINPYFHFGLQDASTFKTEKIMAAEIIKKEFNAEFTGILQQNIIDIKNNKDKLETPSFFEKISYAWSGSNNNQDTSSSRVSNVLSTLKNELRTNLNSTDNTLDILLDTTKQYNTKFFTKTDGLHSDSKEALTFLSTQNHKIQEMIVRNKPLLAFLSQSNKNEKASSYQNDLYSSILIEERQKLFKKTNDDFNGFTLYPNNWIMQIYKKISPER